MGRKGIKPILRPITEFYRGRSIKPDSEKKGNTEVKGREQTSEGHERESKYGPTSLGNKHEFRGGQFSGDKESISSETCKLARLKPLLAKFGRARRLMRNRATWRTWAKSAGLQGIIKALEITHTKNGWHIHTHELLFVRPGLDCLVEAERLLPFWQSACVTAGLPEPNEHGLTVEDGSKASAYVTKWGIEDELTKAHIKKSKGEKGRTPFDFLRDILKDGDLDHGALFKEYYGAFKGKQQLAWSKGLRALLRLGVEKTDEELAAEIEESAILFAQLTPEDWRLVLKTDKRGELLEVAKLGKAAFDEFLRRLKG